MIYKGELILLKEGQGKMESLSAGYIYSNPAGAIKVDGQTYLNGEYINAGVYYIEATQDEVLFVIYDI